MQKEGILLCRCTCTGVTVYSPDIPVSSADSIVTTLVLELTDYSHIFGENSPHFLHQNQSLQFNFIVPSGIHYSWIGKGIMDEQFAWHVTGIEPETYWSWVQCPIHLVTTSHKNECQLVKELKELLCKD